MLKAGPMACIAIASIVLGAGVSSCGTSEYSDYDDSVRPPAESLADSERFVNEMLQEDLGYGSPLRVRNAREQTCLDPPIMDDGTNRVTQVRISASWLYPDAATSKQAMDIMESYVKSQGWNPDTTDSGDQDFVYDQIFRYEMDDLKFSASNWRKLGNGATYESAKPSDWYHEVAFSVVTDCSKQPEDHVMVRSKYDPGYGTSATYYDVEAEREDPADWTT